MCGCWLLLPGDSRGAVRAVLQEAGSRRMQFGMPACKHHSELLDAASAHHRPARVSAPGAAGPSGSSGPTAAAARCCWRRRCRRCCLQRAAVKRRYAAAGSAGAHAGLQRASSSGCWRAAARAPTEQVRAAGERRHPWPAYSCWLSRTTGWAAWWQRLRVCCFALVAAVAACRCCGAARAAAAIIDSGICSHVCWRRSLRVV